MPFWYIFSIKNFRNKDFDIFENYLDNFFKNHFFSARHFSKKRSEPFTKTHL